MPDGLLGPLPNRVPLTIIIPAYDEEAILATNIERLRAYHKDREVTGFEVILASNGSTDRTVEIAREYARGATICPTFGSRNGWLPSRVPLSTRPSTYRSSFIARRTRRRRIKHSSA